MTTQYDGRRFYDDTRTEEWYGAAIQCGEAWAYVEIKGYSQADAQHALRQLLSDKVRINYVELL